MPDKFWILYTTPMGKQMLADGEKRHFPRIQTTVVTQTVEDSKEGFATVTFTTRVRVAGPDESLEIFNLNGGKELGQNWVKKPEL